MATIRAYTTIEQSRKLADILPLESADMYYHYDFDFDELESIPTITEEDDHFELFSEDVCAWSLAALLNYLKSKDKFPEIIVLSDGRFKLTTYIWDGENCIQVSIGDTIVDACYELILKLNELNLL